MTTTATQLLEQWLSQRLSEEHTEWLHTQQQKIAKASSDRELHITLGLIPRKLGRQDLALSACELSQAHESCAGWSPSAWSIDTAARVAVLCRLAESDPINFDDKLTDLCRNADLAESIALYSGISLYPHSDTLDQLVGEGLRTNMRAVFEAIAHNNTYPATHFDENRWNHLVLKALFIDSTLAPIQGLDSRANTELASILCDYAHERWAAGRHVTVELWRCVGPFATDAMIDDLKQVAQSTKPIEHSAGVLALHQSPDPAAKELLDSFPQTTEAIANGRLTWDAITDELQQQ